MITVKNWASSVKDQPISLYLSCKQQNLQNPYLFIGGVHGDEPEGVNLAQNLLAELKNYHSQKDWCLITCLNPDGYQNNCRTNGHQVDLNRNFPSKDWVADHSQSRYYPGPHPKSEPEIKALTFLINRIQPKVIFHFHSWKPEIIVSGPAQLTESIILSQHSFYPIKNNIGYPTPGSLGQYAWYDLKIPVICIEEKEQVCPVESWARFRPAFHKILSLEPSVAAI